MWIVWLIAALAGSWLLFILLPSLISFRVAFRRRNGPPRCPYAPGEQHYEEWAQAKRELEALSWRRLKLRARDGVELSADYLDLGQERTAVCMHGFQSSAMNNFALQGRFLAGQGFNLLFVTQRAHGESGGSYSGLGLAEAKDLLEWLRLIRKENGGDQVLVCGMSMGASAAAYASEHMDREQVKALFLDCPFRSPEAQITRDCHTRHIPWLLMRGVVRALFRSLFREKLSRTVAGSLRKNTIPVLFFHGENDRTVPYEEGLQIYQSCASEKDLFCVPEAGHALAFPFGGKIAEKKLTDLIRRCFDSTDQNE